MTLTLAGRLQSRLVLGLGAGLPIMLAFALVLPGDAPRHDASARNAMILAIMLALGVGWELVYHGLQQLRAERDWPSGLQLLVGVPEMWMVHRACGALGLDSSMTTLRFAVIATTLWLVVWMSAHSVARIVDPMWRLRGGRFF